MALIVRDAVPEDAEPLARLHVASWQQTYRGILPDDYLDSLSVERRTAAWRSVMSAGETTLLAAFVDGEAAGLSSFGPCRDEGAPSDNLELWAIYVHPKFIGQGIGRALWLESREQMAAAGARVISLWVIDGNEAAKRFYGAAGFRTEPDSLKRFPIGGIVAREMRMVCRV